MNPVVIRTNKRAAPSDIATLVEAGVSTSHEAMGRSGLMKPYMRPI
jgi:4-hydroxy-4-methyl-2-oxoglutarate aldolase